MNSFERVTAAFGGHAVDRVPFAVWRHFYPDENEGAAKLAEMTIAFTKRHQLDLIKYNPRAHYHAEPWGTRYRYGKDGHPVLERYAVRRPEDWARIGRRRVSNEHIGRSSVRRQIARRGAGGATRTRDGKRQNGVLEAEAGEPGEVAAIEATSAAKN